MKIDLVNDTSYHHGEFYFDNTLGKIDSWQNILSNKITAIFRYEPKDIVDIWAISKKFQFSWQEIFEEAKKKETAVDPIIIKEILDAFPQSLLDSISWIGEIDKNMIIDDLNRISLDIFEGNNNSLN